MFTYSYVGLVLIDYKILLDSFILCPHKVLDCEVSLRARPGLVLVTFYPLCYPI